MTIRRCATLGALMWSMLPAVSTAFDLPAICSEFAATTDHCMVGQ